MAESWRPLLFQDPPDSQWQPGHQYLYSLLWSAFLDLDAYSASRFRKRFFPYSTHFVVRELMPDNPVVRDLMNLNPRRLQRPRPEKLDTRFRDLALWTVVPKLLGTSPYRDRAAPNQTGNGPTEADIALKLGAEVSKHLKADYDVDVAAFRLGAESRPIAPPGLGLGIGEAKFEISAGRRTAKARLSALVQVPYARDTVARLTDPHTWRMFSYWNPPQPTGQDSPQRGCVPMEILLPGGNRADPNKWRELSFSYGTAITPFEARIDYEAFETSDPDAMPPGAAADEVQRADDESTEEQEGNYGAGPDVGFTEIRSINGYLAFQKVEARPLWTRLVAEREVQFQSPNHDRCRVETLMFWLTCDLVSFAIRFAPPPKTTGNAPA